MSMMDQIQALVIIVTPVSVLVCILVFAVLETLDKRNIK